MTEKNPDPAIPLAADTPTPSPDPLALIAQVRALRALIPDYTQLPVPQRRAMQIVAATNPDFVRASINSIAESTNVEQALGRTPDDLRQEATAAQRWTDLEDEVRALLGGISTGNLVRRNRLGETALAVYSIARRLARQRQHENLLPHVETMRRLNRFGVKKTKAAPAGPPASPSSDGKTK
jgi:hypothetical protein